MQLRISSRTDTLPSGTTAPSAAVQSIPVAIQSMSPLDQASSTRGESVDSPDVSTDSDPDTTSNSRLDRLDEETPSAEWTRQEQGKHLRLQHPQVSLPARAFQDHSGTPGGSNSYHEGEKQSAGGLAVYQLKSHSYERGSFPPSASWPSPIQKREQGYSRRASSSAQSDHQ